MNNIDSSNALFIIAEIVVADRNGYKPTAYRVYNVTAKEFKDLSYKVVSGLVSSGVTVVNFNGANNSVPKLVMTEVAGNKRKANLITQNALTVIKAKDTGKVLTVDAFGNLSVFYKAELKNFALSNARFEGSDMYGDYEEVFSADNLDLAAGAMSMFGDEELESSVDLGEWTYTGDKKATFIEVPMGVMTIKPGTLDGVTCDKLILPETLTELKEGDLKGLRAKEVYLNAFNMAFIGTKAFFDTNISKLTIKGTPKVLPLAFYACRIRSIYAQGTTYVDCIKERPSITTKVFNLASK